MSAVKITNKTMQTIQLLLKGKKDNESCQLLPKKSVTVERTKLTGHEKKLEKRGVLSIVSV